MTRRDWLAITAGLATKSAFAADAGLSKLWVRYVSGGQAYRPSFVSMFLDPMFLEIEVVPYDHPYNFAITPNPGAARGGAAGRGGTGGNATPVFAEDNPPDLPWIPSTTISSGVRSLMPGGAPVFSVLLLHDQLDWPEDARQNVQRAVEAGKGIVVIHHALADNQSWPWWYQEVTGGLLVLGDGAGLKKSTITPSATVDVRPAGNHPIVRDIGPMHLVREETYRGMWQSPKITPLLESSSPGSDKVVAWIGPNEKARVVCIACGSAPETHRNPAYRQLVRNAILWAGERLE